MHTTLEVLWAGPEDPPCCHVLEGTPQGAEGLRRVRPRVLGGDDCSRTEADLAAIHDYLELPTLVQAEATSRVDGQGDPALFVDGYERACHTSIFSPF